MIWLLLSTIAACLLLFIRCLLERCARIQAQADRDDIMQLYLAATLERGIERQPTRREWRDRPRSV